MTENSTHSSLATDDTSSERSILTDQDKLPDQLPYAYARRHGVVIIKDETEQTFRLMHKPSVSLAVLSEVRRLFAQPLVYSQVDQETLEKQLTLIYERAQNSPVRSWRPWVTISTSITLPAP